MREELGADADAAFSAACRAATGGNPLLLRQLLRALEAEGIRPDADQSAVVRAVGPRAVSRTVLLRLARLPADAAAVARAAGVLGESADAAGRRRARRARRGRRRRRDPRARARGDPPPEPPLAFVHPLVRDAVYHEMPPGSASSRTSARRPCSRDRRRDRAGRRAAARRAAPRRAVGRRAAAAGRRTPHAQGRGRSAVAYLRRALEEPPPPERHGRVLLELGRAEPLTSGPAAAAHSDAYEAVADPCARGEPSPLLAAR